MMCALLLYAYCCGLRSSRRIEASCRTDAAFRVICGGLVPDHATISRFVVDHERGLENLFVEGLRLCAAAGLVDLSVIALDGTKIAANASLARNRDADWIRREITKLIALTARDQQAAPVGTEVFPGTEPVAEISSRSGRLARLRAALAVIEAEENEAQERARASQQAAIEQAEHGRRPLGRRPKDPAAVLARAEADHAAALKRAEIKQAERAAVLARVKARGGRSPGRHPGPDRQLERATVALAAAKHLLSEAEPAERRKVNTTDPDSRIMNTKDGWVQGYNCQGIVNKHQIALACDVSQNGSDGGLYLPMTTKLTQTLTAADIASEIELMLADAGYWSEANATAEGPPRLIATMKDHKQRNAARQHGQTTGPPPPDATPVEEMEHLLRTPQGTTAYAQRSCLIEPVFGDRKHNRQIRRFRRRGINAARSEWAFIHLAGNMRKLYQHRTTQPA